MCDRSLLPDVNHGLLHQDSDVLKKEILQPVGVSCPCTMQHLPATHVHMYKGKSQQDPGAMHPQISVCSLHHLLFCSRR